MCKKYDINALGKLLQDSVKGNLEESRAKWKTTTGFFDLSSTLLTDEKFNSDSLYNRVRTCEEEICKLREAVISLQGEQS